MANESMTQNGIDILSSAPKYVDYEQYYNATARRQREAVLRKSAKSMLDVRNIRMGGGFPNESLFPIIEADFKLRDGSVLHIDSKLMTLGLQYGLSYGLQELRDWLIKLQRRVHAPPTFEAKDHPGTFDLITTNGSNEGLNLTLQLFLENGEWLLSEEATYSTALTMVEPHGASVYGIKCDDQGILADDLDRVLSSWSSLCPGTKKPQVLYAVTSGGNPTGVNWSLDRKKAVYHVARAHDLIIIEDDAYYFLQFNRPLIPSLLSLDVDGRVIRLDTFSKVVAPGVRLAIVSGPKPVLQKLCLLKDIGSGQSSGLSQTMLLQLLRKMGYDGFLRHCDSIMEFYKQKAETVMKIAKKHLTGLAEWNAPSGGMFLWLRIPGLQDSKVVVDKVLERRLVLVYGGYFVPNCKYTSYIRVSYALVTDEECDRAFQILADVINEELKNKSGAT